MGDRNTAVYWQQIDRVMARVHKANASGLCVVCGKAPRAVWKDSGALRMTCGDDACYTAWLRGSLTPRKAPKEIHTPTTPNASLRPLFEASEAAIEVSDDTFAPF